ncbi:MAG: hypothetical protein ABEH64_01215 [Salinirussus sp.]
MADGDDDWRYSLEEVGPDDPDDEDGNIAGAFLPDEHLEPGEIELENALFVALGAILAGITLVAFVLALT